MWAESFELRIEYAYRHDLEILATLQATHQRIGGWWDADMLTSFPEPQSRQLQGHTAGCDAFNWSVVGVVRFRKSEITCHTTASWKLYRVHLPVYVRYKMKMNLTLNQTIKPSHSHLISLASSLEFKPQLRRQIEYVGLLYHYSQQPQCASHLSDEDKYSW